MPPRGQLDSSTELALAALQGQISGYTASVNSRIDDAGDRIEALSRRVEDSSRYDRDWKDRVEKQTLEVSSFASRMKKVELIVEKHETAYQRTQGVVWLSKIAWLLIGALVSTLAWGFGKYQDAKVVPAQVERAVPSQVDRP